MPWLLPDRCCPPKCSYALPHAPGVPITLDGHSLNLTKSLSTIGFLSPFGSISLVTSYYVS